MPPATSLSFSKAAILDDDRLRMVDENPLAMWEAIANRGRITGMMRKAPDPNLF
jgi:hypothetical protein